MSEKIREEKHKWRKEEICLNTIGDSDHHQIIEHWVCDKCGAIKNG